jgi:hypothetical protein
VAREERLAAARELVFGLFLFSEGPEIENFGGGRYGLVFGRIDVHGAPLAAGSNNDNNNGNYSRKIEN